VECLLPTQFKLNFDADREADNGSVPTLRHRLTRLAAGDLTKVSDEGLAHLHDQTSVAQNGPDAFHQMASAFTAKTGSAIKGASMGYLDPADLPVVGKAFKQAYADHPIWSAAGHMQGAAGVGAAIPGGKGLVADTVVGAAQGFLPKTQYPIGSKEDLNERLHNSMVGGGLALGLGTLAKGVERIANSKFMQNRAQQGDIIDAMKDGDSLNRMAKGKIDQTVQGINERALTPARDAKNALLNGHDVEVNPSLLEGVDPKVDRYLRMAKRAQQTPMEVRPNYGESFASEASQPSLGLQSHQTIPGASAGVPEVANVVEGTQMGLPLKGRGFDLETQLPTQEQMQFANTSPEVESVQGSLPLRAPDQVVSTPVDAPQAFGNLESAYQHGLPMSETKYVDNNGPISIPATSADRLRALIGKATSWGPENLYNPGGTARIEQAGKAYAHLGNRVSAVDGGVSPINEGMSQDLRLRNFLTKRGDKNPIELVQAAPGTTRYGVLSQADKKAGTDLVGFGKNVAAAKKSLFSPEDLKLDNVLPTVLKAGNRASMLGAQKIQGVPDGIESLSPGLLQLLFSNSSGGQ
jgi:hypothetical protein